MLLDTCTLSAHVLIKWAYSSRLDTLAHLQLPASSPNTEQTSSLLNTITQITTNVYKLEPEKLLHHSRQLLLATSVDMDKFASTFQSFGKTVSSSVTPFAARSQQWIKEQTGNAGEKTELPHDYVELETRIEALKQTHQRLLAATSQYANEAYDYPPNIRESVLDMGKSISEKVSFSNRHSSPLADTVPRS